MLVVIGFLLEICILQLVRIFGIFLITTNFSKTTYRHIKPNTIIFTMQRGLL